MLQDREVLQLSMGRLVRELVEVLLEGASCTKSSKGPSLFLYSGHDATIMPLSGMVMEFFFSPAQAFPFSITCLCSKGVLRLEEVTVSLRLDSP